MNGKLDTVFRGGAAVAFALSALAPAKRIRWTRMMRTIKGKSSTCATTTRVA